MTDSDDLIEQYVSDVVQRLPRRQRDDVATELRTLLGEELADRVAVDGSSPDQTATLALLAGFGRPAEVAARYRPPLVLIDPADSRSFVRACHHRRGRDLGARPRCGIAPSHRLGR